MDGKVIGGELFVDRWVYRKPNFSPDKNGNIVIISKCSFGPPEVYEWGIDDDGKPFEMYKWYENDLYEDENGTETITFEELILIRHQSVDNYYALSRCICEAFCL